MSSGKEAAERIKREDEELQRQTREEADRQLKLQVGIRPFWKELCGGLQHELNDFKEGMKPRADQLRGQLVGDDNFTVFRGGAVNLEIVLSESLERLESRYVSVRGDSQKTAHPFRHEKSGEITIEGWTINEAAGNLLEPIFASFSEAGS
jgi:hypothetical protein